MKTCKKLLAVLLSLMMIASVVIIPATAEETAVTENYVSLLDMSGLRAGLMTEDDATAFPDGLADLGVSRGPYGGGGCGSAYYSGKQEIIELEDGAKAWKINFNKAMTGGGWFNDNKGLFVAKVAVPEKYVPYVTSIKLDMINASNGKLEYQVGVVTGSQLAKKMKESSGSTTTPDAPVELNLAYDITELGKRDAYGAFNGGGTVVANMTYGEAFSHIYFSLKDAEAEDGGLGYAIIKDIGVTLSIPEADIPVEREISLWDLSEMELGLTTENPVGVSEFVAESRYAQYNGTKEVVTNAEGKNVLKLDLNSASFKTACSPSDRIIEGGFSPVYSIKVDIPSDYIQYVKSIKIKFNKQSAMHIAYNFGLTDGTSYSKRNDTGVTMGTAVTGEQVISYTPAQLAKVSAYSAGSWSSHANAAKWDNSFTDLFLWLSAIVPEGTEDAGYITIEDVTVTLSAPVSALDNFPVNKTYSIFDLSEAEVGATQTGIDTIMPELAAAGVTRLGLPSASSYYSGTQEIVKVDGKNAWKINFDTAQSSGGNKNGSKQLVAVRFAVPAKYAGQIQYINANITSNTAGNLNYNMGVYGDSKYGAVKSQGWDSNIPSGTTTTVSYNVTDLNDYGDNNWTAFANGASSGKWLKSNGIAYIYLILMDSSSATGTGYAIINDISVTLSAPQTWHDDMPKSTTVSMWDLSANELGEVTGSVKYPKGVTQSAYAGAMEIVEVEKTGEKALRLDLTNTTFKNEERDSAGKVIATNTNKGRIKENHYSPVYQVQLGVIPSTYAPYVDNIEVKFNKQTEFAIRYSFGVTDGINYSKDRESGDSYVAADLTGIQSVVKVPKELYKCSSHQAGAWGPTNWKNVLPKWNGEFTALYLWVSFDAGATGYVDIEDISYTYTISDAQKAEADAEWEEIRALVNDFEGSGTETPYATSGTKAQKINSGTNGYGGGNVAINSNIYVDEANTLTMWVYNPDEAASSWKIFFNTSDGTKYYIKNNYSFGAGQYAKLVIDLNKANEYVLNPSKPDVANSSAGAAVTLTAEDKAKLINVQFFTTGKSKNLFIDDVYLGFDEPKDTADTLAIDSTIVNGAEVTEDGKIKFASTAEGSDIVAQITVPEGYFSHAETLTLNFDSDVAAEVAITLLGTNDSGAVAHWKWGYQDQSFAVAAGGVGVNKTLNFAGAPGMTFNGSVIHENTGVGSSLGTNCNQCTPPSSWGGSSGHANNPPTPTEKEKITSIIVHVFNNVGEDNQAVTLNSIDVTYAGNTVSAATVEGGSVTVVESKVWAGDTGAFIVMPEENYYLKSVSAVDNLGNVIATTLGGGKDAENLGYYYTFTMPVGHVTVSAEFGSIEGTMPYEATYEGEDLKLEFTVPFVDGKVYNENTWTFETLGDYGVIITSDEALNKYGVDVYDLTPEYINELKESGHHLGNYIYLLDGKEALKTANNANFIKFTLQLTDVTSRARKAPFTMVTYAEFTDAEGNESAPVSLVNYNTMDQLVYGDMLVEEFYAKNGINFQASFTSDLSVWQDIKAQGFDHIRLPISMSNRIDEEGNLIEEKMTEVDYAIENALKAGFSVVVDTHSFPVSISNEYSTAAPIIEKVWDQLAERYAKLPLSVAFQFVNEPATNHTTEDGSDPLTASELMSFQQTLIDNVRAIEGNEDRYIVLSNHNNGEWVKGQYTESILANKNIIVDLHFYSPMSFTHSGSDSWDGIIGNGYEGGCPSYEGTDFVGYMARVAAFAKEYGITVWIGEWGAYQPEYNAKVAYYAEFAKAANDAGVPWSLWEYGSGWSPYKNGAWDQELLDAMFKFDGVNNSATA